MTLLAIVEKYRQLTPKFGIALPLADFGLTRESVNRLSVLHGLQDCR